MEAVQSSPWLSVWLSPRDAIERVVATDPRRHVLLVAALVGIANVLGILIDRELAATLIDWRYLPLIVAASAVLGIVTLFISAFVFRRTARMFGGRASAGAIRAVMAWGAIPIAAGLIGIFAFFALKSLDIAKESTLLAILQILLAALGLWAAAATVLMYARVLGFGFWRATISAIVAWLLYSALILLPLAARAFLFQPFSIPAGSMMPTLLIGDYVFVSKYAYGYSNYSLPFSPRLFSGRILASEPQRGDIVVFRLPRDDSVDYIKRIVGLPGERIQMIDGVLNINGVPIKHERIEDFSNEESGRTTKIKRWRETLPNGMSYDALDVTDRGYYDNTPVYTVPPGHYFVLGDNLDNSSDSRALSQVGYIPFEYLVGRAAIIFFSLDRDSSTARSRIRSERIGTAVR